MSRRKGRSRTARDQRSATKRVQKGQPTRVWWLSRALLVFVLLLPAVTISRASMENFRTPKLLLSEVLALLSLLVLVPRLRSLQRVDLRAVFDLPAVRVALALLAATVPGLLFSEHPHHVRNALASLTIGLAAMVGWSLGLQHKEQRTVLRLWVWPAVFLASIGLLQFFGLIEPFRFSGQLSDRLRLTSLAGGAFDLAAYLLLPALVAQARSYSLWRGEGETAMAWAQRKPRERRALTLWIGAFALLSFTIAATQTLSVLAALALGSVLLWAKVLGRKRLVPAALVALVAVSTLVAVLPPLRERVVQKAHSSLRGDLNRTLTGRLDGWRTAARMLQQNPVLGVGHGAYRAEFARAKLELAEEGQRFFRGQHQTFFANAHSEPLEAAAEWGLWGVACLAWALVVLWQATRQRLRDNRERGTEGRAESALILGTLPALLILALASFPWRLALIAYPHLFFLAWLLKPREVRVHASAAEGEAST